MRPRTRTHLPASARSSARAQPLPAATAILQRYPNSSEPAAGELAPQSVLETIRQPGRALDAHTRADMETRFAHDFSRVRVHTDARAGESARAVSALAYTVGQHVVFRSGAYSPGTAFSRRLLAHELAHVIQQRDATSGGAAPVVAADASAEREADRAAARIGTSHGRGSQTPGGLGETVHVRQTGAGLQRYEAGEHQQMGETQAELTAAFPAIGHLVKKGETLEEIAAKYGVTVDELKGANKALLKEWPAQKRGGRRTTGFAAGELITIPKKPNDFAQSAMADTSAKFTVNGVVLEYGVGIAMGDFFETPDEMAKASPQELQAIAALVRKERAGTPVTHAQWQTATGGRYLKLAERNESHFAPSDPKFVKQAAGAAGPNHKTEWEQYHRAALDTAKAGDKDGALLRNSFADHFLTDAFAAGHLLNKRDLMEQFKGQLNYDAKAKTFDAAGKAFFDRIAAAAFTGSVKTEFSKYESVEYFGNPDINSASRFSALLQGIHGTEPALLASAVAKGVHDKLNTLPGGLPVVNAKGDAWQLSGDNTLNAKTLAFARAAVAQSQVNVISAYKITTPLAYAVLFKKVWDYTPQPATTAEAQVKTAADTGTDVKSKELQTAIVNLIASNYMLIIDELVKRKKLQKV
jgi:hypothetical protein